MHDARGAGEGEPGGLDLALPTTQPPSWLVGWLECLNFRFHLARLARGWRKYLDRGPSPVRQRAACHSKKAKLAPWSP